MTPRNKRTRLVDHLTGALIAIAYLAVLLGTARDVGFSRDEGFYFKAARDYQGWFDILFEDTDRAISEEVIQTKWDYNHEHPALMKVLFGFSHRIFHKHLDIMSPATSYRFPGMVAAALVVYLLFIWGSLVFGRFTGAFAALAFALMPRVFYHAHTACFDIPITAMWLLVSYLYWRSLSSWKFGLGAGIAFGLALCVKLNAFFLPFVLGGHFVAVLAHHYVSKRRNPEKKPRSIAPKPWAFIFGIIFAPAIFLGHWPWLWYHTAHRLGAYVGFHSEHVHYNTAWFGENIIQSPTPLLLPTVMTAITVPTVVVVLFLAGFLLRLRRHAPKSLDNRLPPIAQKDSNWNRHGLDLLLFISVAFPIALISLPSVPVFGGTKHWMPAYPFIALLAGVAAFRLAVHAKTLLGRVNPVLVQGLVVVLLLIPPLQQTITSHPFGLASYVPFAGGAPGAATTGMTRQFWGYTTAGVAPWLNEHVGKRRKVEFHDTARPSIRMFQKEGILRRDIRIGGLKDASFALTHHELHMVRNEAWIWNAFGTFNPSYVLIYQGVPIVSVYERPKKHLNKTAD